MTGENTGEDRRVRVVNLAVKDGGGKLMGIILDSYTPNGPGVNQYNDFFGRPGKHTFSWDVQTDLTRDELTARLECEYNIKLQYHGQGVHTFKIGRREASKMDVDLLVQPDTYMARPSGERRAIPSNPAVAGEGMDVTLG